jgi:ketosteroid isomerase-like protein
MTKIIHATPDEAEAAFYDAFERADLTAMMAIWADQDGVVCVHPQGPRLVGLDVIRDSYKQIFASGMSIKIQIVQAHQYHTQALAVHCVVEMLTVQGENESPPPIAAMNVFALTNDGWRMVAHHAGAVPPGNAMDDANAHTLH